MAYCHPSYAHSTPIIASPTPESSPGVTASGHSGPVAASPRPRATSAAVIATIAATLSAVLPFCTRAPCRVPRRAVAIC